MRSIESYIEEYKKLNLQDVVDYDKFNEYSITAHSTQIEGSTLTQEEAALLLNEGITPKGKPLEHSLMVKDHHEALRFSLQLGKNKASVTLKSICDINAAVMKSTGQIYNTALGSVDSTKGELRKGAVFVQKRYFPSHDKVPNLIESLCSRINEKLDSSLTLREQISLSYSVHFNLVSIHSHYDGNGRTSRLLMNQLQSRFDIPLSVVYKEDKQDYFNALEVSRREESLKPFKAFMDSQYIKYLKEQIDLFKSQNKKLPKSLIERHDLSGDLELVDTDDGLLIKPISESRSGWDEAFIKANMEDGQDDDFSDFLSVSEDFDNEEWEW
ncbi:MAG: Fic family protein [Ekhidna sp.]|nr:Fic family protein [Ekhidna sp.]